jgi:gliding motility-associated-like protein
MVKVYRALIFLVLTFIIYQTTEAQKLYFVDGGDVKRMNLDGTSVETIVPQGTFGFNTLAVDGYNNFIFYNDGMSTFRAALDGTNPVEVTNHGAFAGYSSFAVIPDYESVIYVGVADDEDDLWYGSYYDDPTTPAVLLTTGITMAGDEEYGDIAYNPSQEKIYFSGYDNGAVYSAFQDGTGAAQIVFADAAGPVGVDYINNKVYWVQYIAGNYSIMMANLDGSTAVPILLNGGNSIESIEVYPEINAVFFSQTNAIYRTPLNGAGGKVAVFTGTYITNIAMDFDVTPPVFFALNPTDGSPSISTTANLSLSFNEAVKRSTASPATVDESSFRIYKTVGDVLVHTIDRTSSNISIAANTVTINPPADLEYNTDYYVLAGAKTISDYTENNWVGITQTTGWNFKTEPDESIFYSRQNGNWGTASTWSHTGHTGPPATTSPGTGSDVIIGNGNTVTFTSDESVVGATSTGTWIQTGATLNAATFDFHVWGTLRIDGQLINAGVLSGTFDLYATGSIPIFEEIQYGVSGWDGQACNLYTNLVALNGIQSIDNGTITTNGYQICVPPTPSPTSPVFSNIQTNSLTLSWTAGGGDAFVIAREGSTSAQPDFGIAYNANAAFGSGDAVGTGNFLVYKGTGNTVTVTGLTPGTYYEFDLYSFTTSIGGCYSIQNYQLASATSCIVLPAPTGATNAQYCTGDTKPSINVNSPGAGRRIRWFDAPTGGNLVAGNDTGGDGLGGVFIPNASSGTFYAETYDAALLCSSATRTAVTLTLHPPLVAGTPSINQNICSGGDPTVINGGTASGGTGAFTYQWQSAVVSGGPYNPVAGAAGTTYDPPSGITQTTYYRRVTHSATCMQPGAPVTVSVIPQPSITAQPASLQICTGQGAMFSVTATGSSLTYQWQADQGSGFANINNGGVYSGATTNQLQISNSAGLNNVRYQCIVTSGGACSVTSNAALLVVNPRPAVTNQTHAACENIAGSGTGLVNLTTINSGITGGVSGVTVSWFTDAAFNNPVPTPTNAPASNNTVFHARVTHTATSCTSGATVTISINNKPSGAGAIAGNTSLCTGSGDTFTVSGISNALRYNWQVTSGLEIVSQNGASATIQGVSGTAGTITVTGENSCGTGSTVSVPVQIIPAADLQITSPSEVLVNETANFSFESPVDNFKSIIWDFGDNGTSTEEAPQHQFTTDGTYTVNLTVLTDLNCENSTSVDIIVLPLPDISETDIKNVITANGDTQNGFLYIENLEKYPSNEVVLLDRWGVEVFKKENYLNDWDARRNGEFLPAGQYVCVVKLNETGKIFTRTVSIIKRK